MNICGALAKSATDCSKSELCLYCRRLMADARSHPILYERPSVPDNQTSGLRLADLENITAPNGPCVPYSSLLLDVLPLVQQTAATLCFVAVFLHLHQGTLLAHTCSFRLINVPVDQACVTSIWSEQEPWPSTLAPGSY